MSSFIATPRDAPSVSKPMRREKVSKNFPCSLSSFRGRRKSARQARALTPFSGVLPWAGCPFISKKTVPSASFSVAVRKLRSGPFQASAALRISFRPSGRGSARRAETSAMTTLVATPPEKEVIFLSPSGAKGIERV
ncbi:hypothetical protein MASR2M79_19880 [Aminivibrio sp.]